MIPEIGHFALILALFLSLLQMISPFLTKMTKTGARSLSVSLAHAQGVFVLSAFAALAASFLANDFSVRYVAENSYSQLPAIYRFCAVWGAHEGSMLLWVTLLTLWMNAVVLFSKKIDDAAMIRILGILGAISFGFLLFILLTSNPFIRLLPDIPLNGNDLNPLLQDPGLIIHPPLLYAGYVGLAVPFAFALAGLASHQFDAQWAKAMRPWTLIAWCFLTYGITLGSWWSYHELGWGGWWFWDPVENASFMPWLCSCALLHSLIVSERRNTFKGWTILLAISAFSLSLLGTFLVRSGVLTSVHAFAEDPSRGLFMLLFLAAVLGSSLFYYVAKVIRLENTGFFDILSRETALLLNNVILVVVTLTVLLGTLYPLILDALSLGKISVGPPYFNWIFVPLMAPLLFLMGVAPYASWKQASPLKILKALRLTFLITLLLTGLFLLVIHYPFSMGVALGCFLGFWVLLASTHYYFHYQSSQKRVIQRKNYLGMFLAHLGVGVAALGIVLTSAYSLQQDVILKVGESVQVQSVTFTFKTLNDLEGPNYHGLTGEFVVSKLDKVLATLHPEKRIYNASQTVMSIPGIHAGLWNDFYIALGDESADHTWSIRIYLKPFVRWIWLGGFLMLLGGLIAAVKTQGREQS